MRVCASGRSAGGNDRRGGTTAAKHDDAVRMETVARVVAGGITRSLSDANGGGAARGGNHHQTVRFWTTRRDAMRCERGIVSINFFSRIVERFAVVRSFVRSSTDDDDGAFGGRRGVEAPRRRVSSVGVSLINRPFVIRRFKLKMNNTDANDDEEAFQSELKKQTLSVSIARRRRRRRRR